ncbi:penicillin-binding transpeptidase domain-containing protein [Paenibacillus thalictri]|uniref:Penicillin-binding transpeptidase domain-containing protein n=1 Tax=Paenibacillus thalictri TaxID=2527873 RepID=A0A4Q9DMG7_9BACL|nr:penicillin-binding transpeptidase domain-containing protein [Paenibacillus thalictri]TBL73900.1 penicillin-binding transpeptidase domain-containing protein [Paenibacillus thalictri]
MTTRWMKPLAGCLVVLFLMAVTLGCKEAEPLPEDTMRAFVEAWRQAQYGSMYDLISADMKQQYTADTFTARYKSIYDGIGMSGLSIQWQPVEPAQDAKSAQGAKTSSGKKTQDQDAGTALYQFHVDMSTFAGPIAYDQTARLVKEKKTDGKTSSWKVRWDSGYIHPKLTDKDKVRVEETPPLRGEIVDRQGLGLAINEVKLEIGIVPKQLPAQPDDAIQKLADLLKMNAKDIQAKLKATWVKPEYFVPVTIISADDQRLEPIVSVPGADYRKKKVRSYPLEEAAAHLVGYIGKISAEELAKYKDKGYQTDDWIGKSGLELAFESTLRGKPGGRIFITDADGKEKATLVRREPANGENVQLTIDAELQLDMYRQLEKDTGAGVALHPLTGEVLAMVSVPAYNPNLFISGVSSEQWKQWSDNPAKPLLNRFARAYTPGSAFKPLTAAIALQNHTLDPDAERSIVGKQWKKDTSWGNYYVTRVSESQSAVNLATALMYSDNIYFAQTALELGAQKFVEEASKFGFGEKWNLPVALDTSTLSNNGKMKNEVQLADSGYGQGEVLMTPLHVAATYTVFANGGTMIKPKLLLNNDEKAVPWKSGLISPEVAKTVTDKMVEVIDNPAGTGHDAQVKGLRLAGKTGTAELKTKKDEAGQENGWFVAFDTEQPRLLTAIVVEQVQDRRGSHYISPKIKSLFSSYAAKKQ